MAAETEARAAREKAAIAEFGRHKLAVAMGRAQTRADNPIVAAETLLAEHRQYDSPRTRGALWELYRRFPCVYHVGRELGRQTHVAYSPDGHWLASVQRDDAEGGRLIVYRASTGDVMQILPHENVQATCLAFAPTEDRLYVGGADGKVRSWAFSPDGGQELEGAPPRVLADLTSAVTAVAVSSDGRMLAAGSEQGQVGVWGVQDDQVECAMMLAEVGLVADLSFSSDGARLAVACRSGHVSDGYHRGGVWVFDVSNAREVGHRLDHNCRGVRWSKDGDELLFGDGVVWRWNIAADTESAMNARVQWGVRSLDRSGDGQYLALAGGDGRVHFCEMPSGNSFQISGYHEAGVADRVGVCFSPDGRHVASVASDGLRVWDVYPAALPRLPALPDRHGSPAPAFVSSDGSFVVGQYDVLPPAALDNRLQPGRDLVPVSRPTPGLCRPYLCIREDGFWRVFVGAPSASWMCATAAFLSPDSLVCGRRGPDADVSEIGIARPSAEVLDRLSFLLRGYVTWVGWWQEARDSLLIGCADGRLWTVSARADGSQEPRIVHTPADGHSPGQLTCTAWSPDRRFLAACWEGRDGPGRVVVWRAKDDASPDAAFEKAHELYADFPTHDATWRLAFVRDRAGGLMLVTCGGVRDVHLWQLPTGGLVGRLVGHRDAVRQCVALDDRLLVTASDDKTVRVWDVIGQEEVCELCAASRRPFIGVGDGRVTILDGDRLTVADAREYEQFAESSVHDGAHARMAVQIP